MRPVGGGGCESACCNHLIPAVRRGTLEAPTMRSLLRVLSLLVAFTCCLGSEAAAVEEMTMRGRTAEMPGLFRCRIIISSTAITFERNRLILADNSVAYSYKKLDSVKVRIGLLRGRIILTTEEERTHVFRTRPGSARQAKKVLQDKL